MESSELSLSREPIDAFRASHSACLDIEPSDLAVEVARKSYAPCQVLHCGSARSKPGTPCANYKGGTGILMSLEEVCDCLLSVSCTPQSKHSAQHLHLSVARMKSLFLTIPFFLAFVPSGLVSTALGATLPPGSLCFTQSQPNPIAAQYPTVGTGTANGTIAIIPIPYSTARSIVPSQYPILTNAYHNLMPRLRKDQYPVWPH